MRPNPRSLTRSGASQPELRPCAVASNTRVKFPPGASVGARTWFRTICSRSISPAQKGISIVFQSKLLVDKPFHLTGVLAKAVSPHNRVAYVPDPSRRELRPRTTHIRSEHDAPGARGICGPKVPDHRSRSVGGSRPNKTHRARQR